MTITEINITLAGPSDPDDCLAFVNFTFDNTFAVRDVKIIRSGERFIVAMPSREIKDHCPSCDGDNPIRNHFCRHCGNRLGDRTHGQNGEKLKCYLDVAHPINHAARAAIDAAILERYFAVKSV